MKFKVGDKVRVKSLEWYEKNKGTYGEVCLNVWNFIESMSQYCGKVFIIEYIDESSYQLRGIDDRHWADYMFEDEVVDDKTLGDAIGETLDMVFDELPKESAFDTQVGGTHYTKLAIQPMEYSMKNNLNALQHTIIKYITRYKDKNGLDDLLKAKHCIDMLIEIEGYK